MIFDADAYLARIRLPARPSPDALGLAAVQRAHRLAIPFENLDVKLGRPVAIDAAGVFAQLVAAGRGGYCFQHNRLFGDALTAFGFHHRPLLARVWPGAVDVPPLTHTLSLATIDGQDWIADPGFGGSYTPPMPLADGAEAVAPDGARFVLTRDPQFGWMLHRDGHPGLTDGRGVDGLQPQYSFTLAPVWPADLAMSHHWTSTGPAGRFTRHTVASLVLPHGFASLTDRHYRRRAGEDATQADITDPRVYRMRLSLMFGIDLTADEVVGLGLFG